MCHVTVPKPIDLEKFMDFLYIWNNRYSHFSAKFFGNERGLYFQKDDPISDRMPFTSNIPYIKLEI